MKDNTPSPDLCSLLGIQFPIIMAPMFLVSDEKMVVEALRSGIAGAIPALNYKSTEDLRNAIRSIRQQVSGPFGINLIVNKSNFFYKDQLTVCCEEKVDFIITSLGSPEETIRLAHQHGVMVFCDVVDVKFAKKVEALGADALIAVNKEAGGHAGSISYQDLIPTLKSACLIPVISAGGVGSGHEIRDIMSLGAAGVSTGLPRKNSLIALNIDISLKVLTRYFIYYYRNFI
jgi:nitronate monooxygenase